MTIINSVIKGGGTQPTGTKNITANGVYDVTSYASADVQVPTTAPAYYIEKTKDANNKLVGGSTVINLSGVTDVGDYALQYAYQFNTAISGSVDLSSLTAISGSSACVAMFANCTGITSVDLSSLTTITGYLACSNMFNTCSGITAINLSSLQSINQSYCCYAMFGGCSNITSVDLSSLQSISGSYACYTMFSGCTGLVSVNLSSLQSIDSSTCISMVSDCGLTSVVFSSLITISAAGCDSMFQRCYSLTSLSFPALTSTSFGSYSSQFNNMLSGVTGCTVHFPSNLQSVIGSWTSVTNGFGGTNTTVLFDLTATS